jgi:integrase
MKRRIRGTGSIEHYVDSHGRERYRARLILASGERKPVGVYDSKGEAEQALKAAASSVVSAELVAVTGVTLRAWGQTFLDRRETIDKLRGIRTERNRWKVLVDASPIADLPLRAVLRREAKAWLAWLLSRKIRYRHKHSRNGKPLQRQTLKNALNLIREAFAMALEDEMIAANPFIGLKLPRDPGRTHEPWTFLTVEEQEALIMATPHGKRSLVAFAIGSGLRQAEQWSLQWEDVKWDYEASNPDVVAIRVTVRYGDAGKPTKSGRIRHVPIFHRSRWALMVQQQITLAAYRLVFPSPTGERRQAGEPAGFKYWVKAAGIKRNVRWHDLRHTCGTSLVRGWWGRAWSLEEVKELMGHRSIATTERYAHGAEIEQAGKDTHGPVDEPADSPVRSAAIDVSAGAASGIWTPDLRFTKPKVTQDIFGSSCLDKAGGGL